MTNGQEVDLASVTKAADNLASFADDVTVRLGKIKGEVQQISGTYRGQGSTAFQQSMGNWDVTAVKLRNSVVELSGAVRQAGRTHAQGDAAGAAGIKSAGGTSYNLGG